MKIKNRMVWIITLFSTFPLISMDEKSAMLPKSKGNLSYVRVIDDGSLLAGYENQKGLAKCVFSFDQTDFYTNQAIGSASIEVAKNMLNLSSLSDYVTTDGKMVVVTKDSVVHTWDMQTNDGFCVPTISHPIHNQDIRSSLEEVPLYSKKTNHVIKRGRAYNGVLAYLYHAKKRNIVKISNGQCCQYPAQDFDDFLFTSDGEIIAWNKKKLQRVDDEWELDNNFCSSNPYCNRVTLYANRTNSSHIVSLCHDTDRKRIGIGSLVKDECIDKRNEITIDCNDEGAFPDIDVKGQEILLMYRESPYHKLKLFNALTGKQVYETSLKEPRSIHGVLDDNSTIKLAMIVGQKVQSIIVDMRADPRHAHQD